MTTRKTLALKPEATDAAPALKKKGRGWEISEKRLDALHEQARELRRHSTEAHKALAARFAAADMGRYAFKRYTVLTRITLAMRERIAAKKEAARTHRAANPRQTYSRPKPRAPRKD